MTPIGILRYATPGAFRARAESWLLRQEAENNLVLGLAAQLETSMAGYEPPVYFATAERDGEILGCAFRTPPFNLGITRLSMEAVAPLVSDVAAMYGSLPGVLGADPGAAAVAGSWSGLRRLSVRTAMRERIYSLERVIDPPRPAPGHARKATEADAGTIVRWGDAFGVETGVPAKAERLLELMAQGRMFVWDDGGPRSMAALNGETPNGCRIGYVYTPPDGRGRGYASACVAAASRHALRGGRRFCFLYTDLSNPTSNSIYRRIGYEPVCDVVDYRFGRPPAGHEE